MRLAPRALHHVLLALLPLCVCAFLPSCPPGTGLASAQAHRRAISQLSRGGPRGSVRSVRLVATAEDKRSAYDRAAWEAGYDSASCEIEATRLQCTAGSLPTDLVGTYFRNGTLSCDHLFRLGKNSLLRAIARWHIPMASCHGYVYQVIHMFGVTYVICMIYNITLSTHGAHMRCAGPARFGLGGGQVTHPFDGDGAILSASFPPPESIDRSVTVRFKFVKTPGFVEEVSPYHQRIL